MSSSLSAAAVVVRPGRAGNRLPSKLLERLQGQLELLAGGPLVHVQDYSRGKLEPFPGISPAEPDDSRLSSVALPVTDQPRTPADPVAEDRGSPSTGAAAGLA